MLLQDFLPTFSTELSGLLIEAGEPELAGQIESLKIIQRCSCADEFRSSFYTAPKPVGPYGPGHRNVSLEPSQGMVILDVLNDHIVLVEIIDRPEIGALLSSIPS